MSKSFHIETLGCKVNQYESEAIEEMLLEKGFEKKEKNADIYIINTCTVTNMSDRKSRQTIRKAKRENPKAFVAVIGCYSQVKPEEVMEIEGVDVVLGSRNKEKVVEICEEYYKNNVDFNQNKVESFYSGEKIENLNISSQNDMTRAYIKIQDGCNMFCSYCLIPYARGPVSSRNLQEILDEAKRLSQNGYKEIVITGIHVASYGIDLKEDISLIDVLEGISKIENVKRIRLSSMEPRTITEDFLKRILKLEKVCDHFHLSLQSGSDKILKLMNRKYDKKMYLEKVDLIRKYMPNAAITTDIIVGFPSENDDDFLETVDFINQVKFSRVHIFKYSKREGTRAFNFPNQVDGLTKTKRSKKLSEIEHIISNNYLKKQIGNTLSVLFEEKSDIEGFESGYSTNYIRVNVKSDKNLKNKICDVKILDTKNGYLLGKVI
ncbi:MAG: tRNA (N(6)-L-threonylcarbamoyladenosine(37)-C(2))-methylthiotransferase MtaB [Peptoniphilaceae bacterium]|nr:tRNA (N(6)-L-threonylcarbamoyladenosine(37)-C(2))-methylthiotransferase MtaB [Peptoniphilaceae bacterium]MDD7383503.1 tRNA (N(6)-L-threonylcarbamoyladenosine(37)-C(2))-methylthiotransferase MtaB [Peptoniphilaceae bacterium]MDY3738676.1 tRNA (N(6)-L-threonylcarbamoyladenosine(37)-C(2))-methylthiotransferase MtaB [Peptoniphilaceae bacterium]